VTLAEARAWADHTTGEFSLRTYPGGHFYLIDHAATVTRGIAETLSAIAV
jgi:surfactin synthase thioesterase subunit